MANPNPNTSGLVPFVKGKDKRRNTKGKPKDFLALRKLAQQIAAEDLQSTDGDVITRIEALLRVMSSSKNPADRALFLAYAFGKPKEEIAMNNSGETVTKVIIEYGDDSTGKTAPATQSTEPNKAGAEEA